MSRYRLTPFALALVTGALAAGLPQARLATLRAQQATRANLAMQQLRASSASLGLTGDSSFVSQRVGTDDFGNLHVHVRQTYKGVPVWGGDAILHTDAENQPLKMTDKLVRGLDLAVAPALESSEALAIASRDMGAKGSFAFTPSNELVVLPRIQRSLRAGVSISSANASDVVTTVTGADLAWHLHLEVQTKADTRAMDYLISATNGAILKKWSSLQTAGTPSVGTGNSQYNGTVNIGTNMLSASSYTLQDSLRGSTTVTDLANGTSGGTLYSDADNTWGDGQNYYDSSPATGGTSGVTGQTAAVDAKYGFDMTWDYYKNVHNRNGIDGNGTATTLRMHYSTNYDNAFWSDSCFCMTFGDGSATVGGGSGFKNLTAIDVIGHEISHGVIANSVPGGLTYSDESGGLNEADSDINGTFVTYYAYNGGTGTTVPNTIPSGNLHGYVPWQIGPQISNPPLRYMYKPSLDGASPDAWSFNIGQLDVHYSSGPMNRAMYFLAQGASSTSTDDTYSSYLPGGMTGIGNDKASKIWYWVMTNGLTSNATYHDARIACEQAVAALSYGATELAAVQNAFHAINVGPVAGGSDDSSAPTGVSVGESGTTGTVSLSATATDDVGVANIDFTIDGRVMASATPSTPPTSYSGSTPFDSHLLPNGSHTLTATAFDAYRNKTTSSQISFSTLNSYAQFLSDPSFELGGVWGFGGAYSGISNSPTYARTGSRYAIIGASGVTGESYGYQVFTLPAGLPSSKLTLWTRISNSSYPTTSTSDAMEVAIYDSALNNKLASLGTVTGKNATGTSAATSSWVQVGPFDLSAYGGQTITIVFDSNCSEGKTSFRVDDVGVNTQYSQPDEDASGSVDGIDLGLFAKDFGAAAPLSDFNNDGVVDGSDATILLTAFGQ